MSGTAGAEGARATARALDLPFREAIAFFRQKTNVTTQSYLDVWAEAHSRSFMVAGAATQALVQDFREEITKALEQGTTLQDFRRSFDQLVTKHGWQHTGTPGWRTRIIFETNLSTAYSAGRYAQATEPDTLAVYPYWRYVHSGARHPRLQHLSWNGKVLLASDPWWSQHYPPNGWRCGCRVEVLSARGLKRLGRDGPDPSPPVMTRPWTNPRTGETREVPVGIDPGFDYNPGQAWQGGQRPELPADAVLRPPAGAWPPPVPALAPAPSAPPVPKTWPSIEEADAELTRRFRPWASRLAPEERDALKEYKGTLYRPMNRHLYGAERQDHLVPTIDRLDRALGRARMPVPLRVWRGAAGDDAAAYRGLGVGGTRTLDGFTSSSISRQKAGVFSDGVMVEILVPEGYKGAAYVHPTPEVQHREFEVLFAPRTRVRVVAVEDDRIVVEVLNGRARRTAGTPRRRRRDPDARP